MDRHPCQLRRISLHRVFALFCSFVSLLLYYGLWTIFLLYIIILCSIIILMVLLSLCNQIKYAVLAVSFDAHAKLYG